MQPGQLIAGEFVLQKPLSEGALGEVWRALESRVGRLARLHFVPPEFMDDQAAADRLRRHFDVIQAFRHPHVVATERLVERSEGGAFLVSRHVEGLFLNEYAAQWIRAEGKFPFNLIFDVLRPVASALDEAREKKLAHRGLTPYEIVVSQTEGIQVLDFDLAGIIREHLEKADPALVLADRERLRYLAPEQLLGRPASPLSDQYSFAMIVAELLGNRLMFTATDPQELRRQILAMAPPMLTDYPYHVNTSLQRALYKDPEIRFPSCIHFLDGLAGLIAVAFPPPYTSVTNVVLEIPSAERSAVKPSPRRESTLRPEPTSQPEPTPQPEPIEENFAREIEPDMPNATETPPLENVASFNKIASAARSASANRIAGKIRKERRFRTFFYFWNIVLLLGCLVAVFVLRGHITKVWRQRIDGEPAVQGEPENGRNGVERKRRSTTESAPRSRRARKEKEVSFEQEAKSDFPNIDAADATDEVRFLGTSGKGKKILFVVDASAVMGSGKLTPWEHVVKELVFSFKDLNRSQKYQVVYFNDQANLLPGGADENPWLDVSPGSLKSSYELLKSLGGSGTGNPFRALETAIALKPDVVFFLSDRNGTALTRREIEKLTQNVGPLPIHAVEIGEGDEPVSKSPIRILAETFRGEYKWVNANFHGLKR